jgi:hypothetical protein
VSLVNLELLELQLNQPLVQPIPQMS